MSFPLSAVLVANRGEIAVRIIRAARDLGMRTIAVYAEADAGAPHTRLADEAYLLTAEKTYLSIDALIEVATAAGADCVHPGYGFLSENAEFARRVAAAGLTWVGPTPESIEALGDKLSARRLAIQAGTPLAPGTDGPVATWEEARDFARKVGLPVAIKAAFGGGGRGIKVVWEDSEIEAAFASAGREAAEAFGRAECFVEKFLVRPRHVEAQVLADAHGHTLVLGTRDCTVQRRYQKLIEEAPAPGLTAQQEHAIVEGARAVCQAAGYVGAGTVEYLVAEDGTVSFLEVNTRVQVEHPVTEAVTGVDIVAEQFRVAAGLPLSLTADPAALGHAFEFRINAEDVAHGFVPDPGIISEFAAPTGPGVRTDAGVATGSAVPGAYDSLLAKVIVFGPDRPTALLRARAALDEITVRGVRTVIPFHRDMLRHPALLADPPRVYTNWVDTEYAPGGQLGYEDIEHAYTQRETISIEIDGRAHTLGIPAGLLSRIGGNAENAAESQAATGVTSPLTGSLVSWSVADGAKVAAGEVVAVAEAMKMEVKVASPAAGRLRIVVQPGESIARGQVLAELE